MDFSWFDLLWVAPILGHVLYGVPSRSRCAGECHVSLHNGDDFTAGDEAPHPERLASVRGVNAHGSQSLSVLGSRTEGVRVDARVMPDRPAYVIVETSPTWIELPPAKFESYLAHEGLDWVIEERRRMAETDRAGREIYSKHIKVALAGNDGCLSLLGGALGLPIEFVPVSSPPNMRARLLANSQPLADSQVRVSFREDDGADPEPDVVLRTDELGEVALQVSRPGLWRLHAISMTRLDAAANVEWKSIWTSLTFRVEA
jgi:hypothetical protein